MKILTLVTMTTALLLWNAPITADDHEHKHDEKHEDHHEGEEHKEDEEHAQEDGEHEEEESGGKVGPDKGITEVSKSDGFKISKEAFTNFEIKTNSLSGKGPWKIPSASVLKALEEVNLFRLRDGWYKRIDFQIVRKEGSDLVISSHDLREGDQIVSGGVGFLRIAELSATGGLAHGHSH